MACTPSFIATLVPSSPSRSHCSENRLQCICLHSDMSGLGWSKEGSRSFDLRQIRRWLRRRPTLWSNFVDLGFMSTSMGVDVKTHQPTRPNGLASDGRRLGSRGMVEARGVVRPGASTIAASWRLRGSKPSSIGDRCPCLVGIPGDSEAIPFSTTQWEPSFYQGLVGPLLHSALRRGIAFGWGLQLTLGPVDIWMLSCDSDSSPDTLPLR